MKRTPSTIRAIDIDSDTSELVRRLKAATRIHTDALAASRRFAALLGALRAEGVLYKDGSIWQRYRAALDQKLLSRRLLNALQHKYRRRFGRYWKLKRRRVYKYDQEHYARGRSPKSTTPLFRTGPFAAVTGGEADEV